MSDVVPRQHRNGWLLIVFWLYVGVPLAWGVISTLGKSMALFR